MALELADRKCTLTTNLGDDALELKGARISEGLSSLYEMSLDLVSTNERIKARDLVGTSVAVKMPLVEGERYFNGIVSRFVQLGTHRSDEDRLLVSYQATVVPWFWLLTRRVNCRCFENKTVVEIAEAIFGEHGFGDYEFYKLSTSCKSETMDYCVQYRESDFAFLSRLFERWGLGYTFVHEKDKHVLRIFDDSASLPDNEIDGEVVFAGESGTGRRGDVETWVDGQDLLAGKYSLKDYNFEDPTNDLEMPTNSNVQIGDNSRYEVFDYPGDFVTESGTTVARGEAFAKFRMEAEEAHARQIEGDGVCTGFSAGTHFKLTGHFNDDYNGGKYLLTSVEHSISQGVGTEAEPTIYENSFTCLPEQTVFRPKQTTPRPLVVAAHTALVVGPPGEEIHCDKYGRVRIQFPWDREGQKNAENVCWARVQQGMAGTQFGGIFLPRVGQEVLVTFIEGDPDRPLVAGTVYNKTHMPPYALPANKTQSGWKTRSSMGGSPSNFNEIRFEDKKGSEEIFIQAEKDYNTEIKNDESRWVGNDQELEVDSNRTVHVKGNVDETIDGSETRTVTGSVEETVTGGMKITTPAAFEVTAQGGVKFTAPTGVQVVAPGGQTQVDQFWKWNGVELAQYGAMSNSVFGMQAATTGYQWGLVGAKVEHVGFAMATTGIKMERVGLDLNQKSTDLKTAAACLVTCGFYSVM